MSRVEVAASLLGLRRRKRSPLAGRSLGRMRRAHRVGRAAEADSEPPVPRPYFPPAAARGGAVALPFVRPSMAHELRPPRPVRPASHVYAQGTSTASVLFDVTTPIAIPLRSGQARYRMASSAGSCSRHCL